MVIRFTLLPKNNKEKPAILRRKCYWALTKSCGSIPGKVNETQKAFIWYTDVYIVERGVLSYWRQPQLLGHQIREGGTQAVILQAFLCSGFQRGWQGHTHSADYEHDCPRDSFTLKIRTRCLTKRGPSMQPSPWEGRVLRAWTYWRRECDGKYE